MFRSAISKFTPTLFPKAIRPTLTPIRKLGIKQPMTAYSCFSHLNPLVAKPQGLWVIDKNGKSEKKPTAEVENKHNFEWRDDITIPRVAMRSLISQGLKVNKLFQRPTSTFDAEINKITIYLHNVDNYTDQMALKDMGDLGHGVVARKDFYFADSSFLNFYAGIVSTEVVYEFNHSCTYKWGAKIQNILVAIDAMKAGNFSRFMAHLPRVEELSADNLPGIDLEKVATENTRVDLIDENEITFPSISRSKPIKAGDLIGYSYGYGYWKNRAFWLLTKSGEKITPVEYNNRGEVVFASQKK